MIAVLHTHSRQLHFHPHIHVVMPATAINKKHKLWRQKDDKYIFNHRALAKVFRAKILAGLTQLNLEKPKHYPQKWVVDVQSVGAGDKALVYLGRYLYRGVIQEKDILSVKEGKVTFRYLESKIKRYKVITLSGIQLVQLILKFNPLKWIPKKKLRKTVKCRCCGAPMHIVQTRIKRSILMTPT